MPSILCFVLIAVLSWQKHTCGSIWLCTSSHSSTWKCSWRQLCWVVSPQIHDHKKKKNKVLSASWQPSIVSHSLRPFHISSFLWKYPKPHPSSYYQMTILLPNSPRKQGPSKQTSHQIPHICTLTCTQTHYSAFPSGPSDEPSMHPLRSAFLCVLDPSPSCYHDYPATFFPSLLHHQYSKSLLSAHKHAPNSLFGENEKELSWSSYPSNYHPIFSFPNRKVPWGRVSYCHFCLPIPPWKHSRQAFTLPHTRLHTAQASGNAGSSSLLAEPDTGHPTVCARTQPFLPPLVPMAAHLSALWL